MAYRTDRVVRSAPVRAALAVALAACAPPDDDDDDGDGVDPPGAFLEATTIIVVANPVINQGSSTDVEVTGDRADHDIAVRDSTPEVRDRTDATGVAELAPVPVGTNTLVFETGTLDVDVQAEGELYDVVVSIDGSGVDTIIPPIRYPVGGDVRIVEPGDSIADAATDDGAIVVLMPGTHVGGFEVRAADVLLFGYWKSDEGSVSVVDGDVTWLGGGGRMRGVRVDGVLTANANDFSAAFCELGDARITGNGDTLIRNSFTGGAVVPSSDAVLVDNDGIP